MPKATIMERNCGIYKYIHNGKIIYIGQVNRKTSDIYARIYEHSKEPKFKQYKDCEIWFADMADKKHLITAAEIGLIDQYTPILNEQSKPKKPSEIDFEKTFQLTWEKLPEQKYIPAQKPDIPITIKSQAKRPRITIRGEHYSRNDIARFLQEEENSRKAFAFCRVLLMAKEAGKHRIATKFRILFGERISPHEVKIYDKEILEYYSLLLYGNEYDFFSGFYIPSTIKPHGGASLPISIHGEYDEDGYSHISYYDITPGLTEKFIVTVSETLKIISELKQLLKKERKGEET